MAPNKLSHTLAVIMVGIVLALGGLTLDGFVGGALQGAGLALILLGVYALGSRWRTKGGAVSDTEKWWLPSEGDQR